jgi:hypothetical protein
VAADPQGAEKAEAEAWDTLTAALGQQVSSVGQGPYDALLRLDKPEPGVAAVGAFNIGGQSTSRCPRPCRGWAVMGLPRAGGTRFHGDYQRHR